MIAEKDVMDMRRCVIVGGAEIRTYDRVRQYFRPDDFFIYCDCGLRHQKALGAEPDLIVGGRKSTRLNSSHWNKSRMPSSA